MSIAFELGDITFDATTGKPNKRITAPVSYTVEQQDNGRWAITFRYADRSTSSHLMSARTADEAKRELPGWLATWNAREAIRL